MLIWGDATRGYSVSGNISTEVPYQCSAIIIIIILYVCDVSVSFNNPKSLLRLRSKYAHSLVIVLPDNGVGFTNYDTHGKKLFRDFFLFGNNIFGSRVPEV